MLKMKYKFIQFKDTGKEMNGKPIFECANRDETHSVSLGVVYYYPGWKKHVFSAERYRIFDATCLRDIQDFLNQLDKE